MNCRIVDLRHKEVINIEDGRRIGCVNDVEVDMISARLVAIIIYGKLKFFGIFGREDDIIIKWKEIKVIGEDTILVKYCPICKKPCKKSFLKLLFNRH